MKTHKKLVSILCAVALLASALPAASAVSADPLSKYAGETIELGVNYVEANGEITRTVVDVAIPQNATQKEELTLVNAAASSVTPCVYSAREEEMDMLLGKGGYQIGTSQRMIGEAFLDRNYDSLKFYFNGGSYTGDPTKLTIELDGGNLNGLTYTMSLTNNTATTRHAELLIVKNKEYNIGYPTFVAGDSFDLYCNVNRGSITFAGIFVYGVY